MTNTIGVPGSGEPVTGIADAVVRSLEITTVAEDEKPLAPRSVVPGEKEYRWTRLLADAGAQLSASLDVTVSLDAVSSLAVEQVADYAMVHLKVGEEVRTVAVHHAGGQEELVWDVLRRCQTDPEPPHGFPPVMRSGQPELLSEIDDEVLSSCAVDDEHLEMLKALELRSMICVPMTLRNEVVGALTLAAADPGRVYDAEDLALATELARRCAAAIDNARLYEEAKEAIAARDEFLSVAAHELRTPLAALLLTIHGVERAAQRLDDEQLRKRVARLPRQLETLAQLVERLLDVSRIRAGRVGIGTREMDLALLIRDVAERFRAAAAQVDSSIDVQTPEGEVLGVWDHPRLDEVLTNLLGNAIKFAPGSPIEIRLSADETDVCFSVRDHGIGIPPEKLPFVFDRFER
ncbi:MAG: GAF domain-containing sensor histidine kinase, partial [Gemmatimonadetes bacterium]|nr:GAF domain-containing sensor histidine kinase [Gemmatimonadota bacterium]